MSPRQYWAVVPAVIVGSLVESALVMLADPLKETPLIVLAVCRVVAVAAFPLMLPTIAESTMSAVSWVKPVRSVTTPTVQPVQ